MFLGLTSLVYLREVARSFRSLVALWQSGTESQGTEDIFYSAIRLLSGRFSLFQVKHWHSTNYARTTGGAFTLRSR